MHFVTVQKGEQNNDLIKAQQICSILLPTNDFLLQCYRSMLTFCFSSIMTLKLLFSEDKITAASLELAFSRFGSLVLAHPLLLLSDRLESVVWLDNFLFCLL